MNRISIEFKWLCIDIALVYIDNDMSNVLGDANFLIESVSRFRCTKIKRHALTTVVLTYALENLVDSEYILGLEFLSFLSALLSKMTGAKTSLSTPTLIMMNYIILAYMSEGESYTTAMYSRTESAHLLDGPLYFQPYYE